MYLGRGINLNPADVHFIGEHLVTMRVEVASLLLKKKKKKAFYEGVNLCV